MFTEQPITTTFVLQRDEFVKAGRLALRGLPRWIRVVGWVQCALLGALLLLGVAYQPDGSLQPVGLFIAFVAWAIFALSSVASRALLNFQFKRREGKEVRYEIDDTGFKDFSFDGEWRLNWSAFSGMVETDSLIVLVLGVQFYALPKRALSTDSVDSLGALIAEKLPKLR